MANTVSRGRYGRSRMVQVVGRLLSPDADINAIADEFRLSSSKVAWLRERAFAVAELALRKDVPFMDYSGYLKLIETLEESRSRLAILRAVLVARQERPDLNLAGLRSRLGKDIRGWARRIAGEPIASNILEDELNRMGTLDPLPAPLSLARLDPTVAARTKNRPGPKPQVDDARLVEEIRKLDYKPLPGYRRVQEDLLRRGITASPLRVRNALKRIKPSREKRKPRPDGW